jgi:class 3 adenylate cyclase
MFDSCRGHSRQREAGAERFEGRSDYAAISAVTNLASRLADEASAGQILIDQRGEDGDQLIRDLEADRVHDDAARASRQFSTGLPHFTTFLDRACEASKHR